MTFRGFLACLALLGGLAQTEKRRESWPDGSVRTEYEVVIDRNGREQRSGPYRAWYMNGNQASEGVFAADRESGRWKFFHSNGELASQGNYARGERNGMWETFHEEGGRASRGRYKKGRRTGSWSFVKPDGSEDELTSGVWEYQEYRAPDGRVALSGYLLDGQRHDRWESAWPDLTTQLTGEYRRGARHGPWFFHHGDGSLSRALSGQYEAGRRVGPVAMADEVVGNPNTFPAPQPGPLGKSSRHAEIAAELGEWLALDERALRRRLEAVAQNRAPPGEWLLRPAQAWPLVLKRLMLCSPEMPAGLATIQRLDLIALRPLCGGRGLGGAPPADAAEARDFVASWLSAWGALREDCWLWEVELPLPVEGETVLELPFLEAPGTLEPPPLYAKRFGPLPRGLSQGALDAALDWLVQNQRPDGSWSSLQPSTSEDARASAGEPGYHVGVSALCLLALLGDGHTPERGKHSQAMARGVAWLLAQQNASNDRIHSFFSAPDNPAVTYVRTEWIYEHLLATLVLCETLALHPSPALRAAAQRALDLVLEARNPYGGWRYAVPPTGENDTSVTAWAVLALHAAREAGLEADYQQAFSSALALFDDMTDMTTGRVGYDAPGSLSSRTETNQSFPREKGEAMTATALVCRRLLGQTVKQEEILGKHIRLLHTRPPSWDAEGLGIDEYYFSIGALALALCGELRPWLPGIQEVAKAQTGNLAERGSWEPLGAWAYTGGRVYSTAMLALMLEAPKRYALPEPARNRRSR